MTPLQELENQIASLQAHIDAATHRMLTLIRELDEARYWAERGTRSCAAWMSWRLHMSIKTAQEKLRVAHALGELPGLDEAFRLGSISYSKVRAIARVATPEGVRAQVHPARPAIDGDRERDAAAFVV